MKRFLREARAAARLHHTNIVPVFGVGEQDGHHYYVMQYIQGLGLDEVLDELRKMDGKGDLRPVNGEYAMSAVDVARSILKGRRGVDVNDSADDLALTAKKVPHRPGITPGLCPHPGTMSLHDNADRLGEHTMNLKKPNWKLIVAGVLVTGVLGALTMKFAWASHAPGNGITITTIAGPALIGDIDTWSETDDHEIEIKSKGVSDVYFIGIRETGRRHGARSTVLRARERPVDVDSRIGALAEDHLPGASVGPLIAMGLLDQRPRDGEWSLIAMLKGLVPWEQA